MSPAQARVIESPSGKGAGDENFPVGSILLPARLRPHVAVFYAFARAIDDIADHPRRTPEDKLAALDGFEAALTGKSDDPAFAKGLRMRQSLEETGVTARHCRDLISAFKQDAVKGRYADWDELIDYCNRSAAPVGRYLLDLHGESPRDYAYSDALCNALQVLNHLQDCADDYRNLDRVYLPQEWMVAEGAEVADLAAPASSPALRRVLDRALDGTDELLRVARGLPGALSSRRLAMESAVILRIAEDLSRLLRRRDPLAERVELGRTRTLLCAAAGLWRVVRGG